MSLQQSPTLKSQKTERTEKWAARQSENNEAEEISPYLLSTLNIYRLTTLIEIHRILGTDLKILH